MLRVLVAVGLAFALGAFAVRRARSADADMRSALKRRSRRNRSYWFSLTPIERPK